MAAPTLAIDFGTTRTKVAYFEEATGRAALAELGKEVRAIIPSVFYVPQEGHGRRLVGDDAQEMVDADPTGIVLALKREIHKLGKKRFGAGRPAVERIELASELFSYIRQRCQEEIFHQQELVRCQLTVPVDFKEQQREAIRQAAQLGGFRETTTIEEPVAAAKAWLRNHSGERLNNTVVVCDVGGGTTDFAFLRYEGGNFEMDEDVLSSGFLLGGNDLDELIWEQLRETQPANGADSLSAAFLIKIRRERELLSKTDRQSIPISVGTHTFVLSREAIEAASSDFVKRIKQETERFLQKIAKQSGADKSPLLLVGGASRLSGLRQALESLGAGDVYLWNYSDYATVLGAVDIPAKPSAYNKKVLWDEYGKAVEMAWADRVLQRAEFAYLVTLQEKLGLLGSEVEQIEKACMGATKEALMSGSNVGRATSPHSTPDSANAAKEINDLIGNGKCDEAFAVITTMILEHPSDDNLSLWNECACTVADGEYVLIKARTLYSSRDKDVWSACCLVLALLGVGRIEEAVHVLTPHLGGSDISTFPLLFAQYYLPGDEGEQKAILGQLQLLRPNDWQFWASSSENYESALSCLNDALFKNPFSFNALFYRSNLFLTHSVGIEAMFQADLRLMERIAATNFFTLAIKGVYLAERGDYQGARPLLSSAVEDPRSTANPEITSSLLLKRSVCNRNLGDANAAWLDTEQSIRINPRNWGAMIWRANQLRHMAKFEEAIQGLNYVLTHLPGSPHCLIERGWCLSASNRFSQASEDFQSVWRADELNLEAKQGAAYCEILGIASKNAAGLRNVYLWPSIPQDKLQNAFQRYLVGTMPEHSTILLLYDDTYFGGAKEGFCLTEDAIYWHNQLEDVTGHFKTSQSGSNQNQPL